MDILREIETAALTVREKPPTGDFMTIEETAAEIELPMERPLFTPPIKPVIADSELENGEAILDMAALYSQVTVNKQELIGKIRRALQMRSQIGLHELLCDYPLEHGLAEIVGYMQIASEWPHAVVAEKEQDIVEWRTESGIIRRAKLPKIIFARH
jgi:hypothetical protein